MLQKIYHLRRVMFVPILYWHYIYTVCTVAYATSFLTIPQPQPYLKYHAMSYFLAKAVLLHFFGLYTSCSENMTFLLNLCSLIGCHRSQSKLFRHTKILHSPRPAVYRLHIFGLNSLKNRQSSLQQLKLPLPLADLY